MPAERPAAAAGLQAKVEQPRVRQVQPRVQQVPLRAEAAPPVQQVPLQAEELARAGPRVALALPGLLPVGPAGCQV